MKKLLLLLLLPLILGIGPINGGPINFGGAGQALDPGASPTFEDVILTDLSDGRIPYHVNDTTGLADGPLLTDVTDAVNASHDAATVSTPLSISGQAISVVNDDAAVITEIDTDALANSDTVVPTSKAITTALASKMNVTGSNLAIGSDADGDIYYRAAGVLARLAKGTANYKLFMNAGETAPEWAAGASVVSSTYNMANPTDAAVDYTFNPLPSVIIALAVVNGTTIVSIGVSFEETEQCIYQLASGTWTRTANRLIYLYESAGKTQDAKVASRSGTTVTLSWTRTGATASQDIQLIFLGIR